MNTSNSTKGSQGREILPSIIMPTVYLPPGVITFFTLSSVVCLLESVVVSLLCFNYQADICDITFSFLFNQFFFFFWRECINFVSLSKRINFFLCDPFYSNLFFNTSIADFVFIILYFFSLLWVYSAISFQNFLS
jgi:hypothetical protein